MTRAEQKTILERLELTMESDEGYQIYADTAVNDLILAMDEVLRLQKRIRKMKPKRRVRKPTRKCAYLEVSECAYDYYNMDGVHVCKYCGRRKDEYKNNAVP